MRILHIIDSLNTGGAEFLVANVVNSMKEHEHRIVVLVEGNDYQDLLEGIRIDCLNYSSKLGLPSAKRQLKRIIKEHKTDLIHSHLLTATFVARQARPATIPLLFSVHNILSKSAFEASQLSYYLEKYSYKEDHHALFVSDEARKDYDNVIGIKGAYSVLPNFVSDEFFDPEWERNDHSLNDPVSLVAVGSLKEQKNYSFLIKSLRTFNPNIELHIIGKGPLKEKLEEQIRQSGMEDRVKLLGGISEVYRVLKNYDLFIMASRYEGFGIALTEAMAAGLPTLISNAPTLVSLSDGASSEFELGNESDFREKLQELIDNQNLRESSSQKGKKRAKEICGKTNYLQKLEEIYKSLCL